MSIKTNDAKEIATLYELGLSIGNTLDLDSCCDQFLTVLMARKKLTFASVWIKESILNNSTQPTTDSDKQDTLRLVYENPRRKIVPTVLPVTHPIYQLVQNESVVSITANNKHFQIIKTDSSGGEGIYTLYPLGGFGVLMLFSANDETGSQRAELEKLQHIILRFSRAIESCLDHNHLFIEVKKRELAEIALRKGEEKYRDMFESIQDVYAEISADESIILEISPSIERVSGYTRDEMIGKSIVPYYASTNDRQRLSDALTRTGVVSDFEVSLIKKDGQTVACSFSVKLVYDINGKPDKIVGTMRDINLRKKAESELQDSLEKLKKYNQLMVNREERVLELKKTINELSIKQNLDPKYKITSMIGESETQATDSLELSADVIKTDTQLIRTTSVAVDFDAAAKAGIEKPVLDISFIPIICSAPLHVCTQQRYICSQWAGCEIKPRSRVERDQRINGTRQN